MEDLLVILVVEDDQMIQTFVEDALTDGGFESAIAPSGGDAVTLLQGNRGKYCALVTDINLQGRIHDWEVAKQAREIDPAFPVITLPVRRPRNGPPTASLLTRPFEPAQLVTAVSQLLNSGAPTT